MRQGDAIENELYIRNYEAGMRTLTAFHSMMIIIEKNLEAINLENLLKEILDTEADTLSIKNRYYFLESRLNSIMGEIAQKMTTLNQEKNMMLTQPQL